MGFLIRMLAFSLAGIVAVSVFGSQSDARQRGGACSSGSCAVTSVKKTIVVEKSTQPRQPAGAHDKDGKPVGGQFVKQKTVIVEASAAGTRRHFGRFRLFRRC